MIHNSSIDEQPVWNVFSGGVKKIASSSNSMVVIHKPTFWGVGEVDGGGGGGWGRMGVGGWVGKRRGGEEERKRGGEEERRRVGVRRRGGMEGAPCAGWEG